jgi:saccharopine dehydrogenase (NAD+, L-lysine-forming)
MTHLWVRAEQRANEQRVGLTPSGARDLLDAGIKVTVEDSQDRAIPIAAYHDAGCQIVRAHSWPEAPVDAIVFGLKELPEDGSALIHRHIMFGHAFKGQHSGRALLDRFRKGGGTLYDLEYLVDATGRRVAAFGYWAGFVGAAVTVKSWIAQQNGVICPPVNVWPNGQTLIKELSDALMETKRPKPRAIVIGAMGRVGTGGSDLCEAIGLQVTKWDMAETASGGPFPEILEHEIFLNCILARPGTPVFISQSALSMDRKLTAIGDIACDPDSDYNPIPIYSQATNWSEPITRVHSDPVLDIMAIDNLPSLLPAEASEDFANQLLPHLLTLPIIDQGVWGRGKEEFDRHI